VVMPDNQTLLGLHRMSQLVAWAAVSAESAAVQVALAPAGLVAQQAAPVIPGGMPRYDVRKRMLGLEHGHE